MIETQRKSISLIGSSIFEFWGTPSWPNCELVNEAIRSTQSQDWLERDLTDLAPVTHRFVYCGSNDLIFGKSVREVIQNCQKLLIKLRELQPKAKLFYFSILQCPQKEEGNQLEDIAIINAELRRFCDELGVTFVDFNQFIANEPRWFVEDGLHLSQEAYQHLVIELGPFIERW